MEKNVKKAFELAQEEVQEKEIVNLKNIIKDLLQKKVNKEKEKNEIEKDIKIIKQTIDDFKAGRLDKIKELIEKDDRAKDLVNINITIINNNNYPLKPWLWVYAVQPMYYGSGYATISAGSGTGTATYYASSLSAGNYGGIAMSGQTCATALVSNCSNPSLTGVVGANLGNFVGGSYQMANGGIITL